MTDRSELYVEIKKWCSSQRIVILQGLRRTGKTTILEQLFNEDKHSDIKKYHEFDTYNTNEEEVIKKLFSELTIHKDKSITLYFDEFQDYSEWNTLFKTIYDQHKNIKVVATGSVSHNTSATNNTEGGRYFIYRIDPLLFKEYKAIFEDTVKIDPNLINAYITWGSYPDVEWTKYGHDFYKKKITDNILEKITNGRLLEERKISSAKNVDAVMLHIFEYVGCFQSANIISKSLQINEVTVQKILKYLKDSFLINEVNVYHKQKGKALMWNSKFYLTDPSMYCYVNHKSFESLLKSKKETEQNYASFLLENMIFNHLRKINPIAIRNIFYHKTASEDIDFVYINSQGETCYIEVKSASNINCLSRSQLDFSTKHTLNVIYYGETKKINNIKYINIEEFISNIHNDWFEHD